MKDAEGRHGSYRNPEQKPMGEFSRENALVSLESMRMIRGSQPGLAREILPESQDRPWNPFPELHSVHSLKAYPKAPEAIETKPFPRAGRWPLRPPGPDRREISQAMGDRPAFAESALSGPHIPPEPEARSILDRMEAASQQMALTGKG